jgi:ribosomal protein S12
MAKQSKKPADLNRLAAAIVGDATDDASERTDDGKDPAAVALGRKGGKKGGKTRAARMTPKQRSDAARKAARARWESSGEK